MEEFLQILNAPATSQFGAGGLVAFIILLILRGLLIPKSWVSERLEQADKRAEEWKQIAEQRQEMLNSLGVVARTANHVLESLPVPDSQGSSPTKGGQ